MTHSITFLVATTLALMPLRAGAECNDADTGEASELFREGRKLLEIGKAADACLKFEQSLLKDPRAIGTLLNLGLCNERTGKIATAVRLFGEALARATEANLPEYRDAARTRIMVLSPRVPILSLHFTEPPPPRTILVIDDRTIATDLKEVPIDPGHHTLSLSAPGRISHEQAFEVAENERRTLELPALRVAQTRIVDRGGLRFYGKAVVIGGAATTAVALGLAAWGQHLYNAQFPSNCGGDRPPIDGLPVCNAEGRAATDRARVFGNVATITGGIGIAAMITGAIIIWRSPGAGVRIVPTTSGESVGAMVTSSF